VEVLPDRFDNEGRPLDRNGNSWRGRDGWRTSEFASKDGRIRGRSAIWRSGGGERGVRDAEVDGGQEMVERIMRDVGDVVEGRKSWRELLTSVVSEAGGAGSQSQLESGEGAVGKRRRRE